MVEQGRVNNNAKSRSIFFKSPVNVALTGFMGSGKTTVGQLLACMLEWDFFDTDEIITKIMDISISDIFAERGEEFFRNMETEVVKRLGERDPGTCVIATGGGAILREENRAVLRKNGLIVYLDVPAVEIYRRLKNKKDRPLLNVKNPQKKIEQMLQQRIPFYLEANLRIEAGTKSPHEVANEIIAALQK